MRSNRYGYPLSMAMFDLDNFKLINDRHGHKAGDIVLQNISRLVSARIRESDFFAPLGRRGVRCDLSQSCSGQGGDCYRKTSVSS